MLFLEIMFAEASLQVLIVSFGGSWFKTVPLSLNHWILCVGLGLGTWPWQIMINITARVGLVLHSKRVENSQTAERWGRKQYLAQSSEASVVPEG
jgi:hypothetical protein